MTLYEEIGSVSINEVVTEFYKRAFEDVIIGHFFFEKERLAITKKQIDFATAMLGGPRSYTGQSLEQVHSNLGIRAPHFGRRQVLMAEVLKESGLTKEHSQNWLALEERLRPLIFNERHCFGGDRK